MEFFNWIWGWIKWSFGYVKYVVGVLVVLWVIGWFTPIDSDIVRSMKTTGRVWILEDSGTPTLHTRCNWWAPGTTGNPDPGKFVLREEGGAAKSFATADEFNNELAAHGKKVVATPAPPPNIQVGKKGVLMGLEWLLNTFLRLIES